RPAWISSKASSARLACRCPRRISRAWTESARFERAWAWPAASLSKLRNERHRGAGIGNLVPTDHVQIDIACDAAWLVRRESIQAVGCRAFGPGLCTLGP